MLDLTSDDLKIVHRLDDRIKKLYEARMGFLLSADPTDSGGLVDPSRCWDTAAPVIFRRSRVNENGRWYIEGMTAEAKRQLPKVPEAIWSAVEGGRVVVRASELPSPRISNRVVRRGQLEFAHIEGDAGLPIELHACTMEECIFWRCNFEHCHFIECDFIKSHFISCRWKDCTVTECFFDETVWGDRLNRSTTYNTIEGLVINGEISFKGARGVGAALFMPEQAINIATEDIDKEKFTSWKGEQLHHAITQRKWD